MHNVQLWVTSHFPHFTAGSRSLDVIVVVGAVLLISLAVILERQRPTRRCRSCSSTRDDSYLGRHVPEQPGGSAQQAPSTTLAASRAHKHRVTGTQRIE